MIRVIQNPFGPAITDTVLNAALESISGLEQVTRTAIVIKRGILSMEGGTFFIKALNAEKLHRLYGGDYGLLWGRYIKKVLPVVSCIPVLGLLEVAPGHYLDISNYCRTVVDDVAETLKWDQIYSCFCSIVNSVESLSIQYPGRVDGSVSVGIDTAFWNFSVDGKLIDLHPPRFETDEAIGRTAIFSRPGETEHFKMLRYRTLTVEGMILNALATVVMKSVETTTLAARGIVTGKRIDELVGVLLDFVGRHGGNSWRNRVEHLITNGEKDAEFRKHPANILVQLRREYSLQ